MSGLRRSLGPLQATAMVVGTIIGASIFVQPSEITARVPSLAWILLAWGAAGALTLLGALITAELASAIPRAGGVYDFLREAFAPSLGFLWGWAMFWIMHSGIIAAIAVIFARYAGYFVPLNDWGIRLVAIGAVAALSGINLFGVRQGAAIQTGLTLAKLLAIAIILAAGFTLGASLPDHFVGATGETVPIRATDFAAAVGAGLFAFGGWHMVTYTAEETREPERTLPRALAVGTLVVTVCYIALNAAYLYVLPLDRVIGSERVAADAAESLIGTLGGSLVSGLVLVSTFGALAGIVLTGPRVYYAMAQDGLLFRWAGHVHPRFGTPSRAIALQAVWSSVLVATGSYRALFSRVIFTEWLFFGLMALGLLLLRRRAGHAPRFRVPAARVVVAVFAAASGLIVINQILTEPADSGIGLLFVASGLPVYALWSRRRSRATEPER
ncbi:MAG: APC family permease [Gemmatimonadales bacterium]